MSPVHRVIGQRLREARRAAGLTQTEVAKRADLSTSFVRLVESGRSDISLSRLLRWTSLFDIPVADLFAEDSDDPVLVVRQEQRLEVPIRERGVRFYLLAPSTQNLLEPAIFSFAPGATMSRSLAHHGEEAVFVLRGEIRLQVGSGQYDLRQGTTAYYESWQPHLFSNPHKDRVAEILVTASHPALHEALPNSVEKSRSRRTHATSTR